MNISVADFLFKEKFPGISDAQYTVALEQIRTVFYGVDTLWGIMSAEVAEAKRKLCWNYLLGWQLMQTYPDQVRGMGGMGAMPLSSKSINDVHLNFKWLVRESSGGLLDTLMTNWFGQQALVMFQTAPECFMLQR